MMPDEQQPGLKLNETGPESPFSRDARRWRSRRGNRQAAVLALVGSIILVLVVAVLILAR